MKLLAWTIGGIMALCIASTVLPRIEVHVDEYGTVEQIQVDWSRTMVEWQRHRRQ